MTATTPAPPGPTALIVAGMHRSGTSLVASMLADAGLHLGDHLMGPGQGNPEGHYEDLEMLAFHRRVLAANGLGTDGFTAQQDILVPSGLTPESERLIAARRSRGIAWGWKEPRTTLFLDHWAGAIPEARFLLLFRRPWEVIDSLFRRGDLAFGLHPPLAVDVWRRYNEAIREFHERHADRCLLVELTQVTADPEAFSARLRRDFRLTQVAADRRFQPGLLAQDASSPRAGLLATIDEQAFDLYLDLRSRAGSASTLPAMTGSRGRLTEGVLGEWRRAAAAERLAAEASQRLVAAGQQIVAAEQQLVAAERTAVAAGQRITELEHQATEATRAEAEARAGAAAALAELETCRTQLERSRTLTASLERHLVGSHDEVAELRRLLASRDAEIAAAAAARQPGLKRLRRLGKRLERAVRSCRDRCLGGRSPAAGTGQPAPPEAIRPAA